MFVRYQYLRKEMTCLPAFRISPYLLLSIRQWQVVADSLGDASAVFIKESFVEKDHNKVDSKSGTLRSTRIDQMDCRSGIFIRALQHFVLHHHCHSITSGQAMLKQATEVAANVLSWKSISRFQDTPVLLPTHDQILPYPKPQIRGRVKNFLLSSGPAHDHSFPPLNTMITSLKALFQPVSRTLTNMFHTSSIRQVVEIRDFVRYPFSKSRKRHAYHSIPRKPVPKRMLI